MLTYKPWKIESILQMLLGMFGGMALAEILATLLGYKPEAGQVDHAMMIAGAFSFHGVGLFWLNWFVRDHDLTWPEVLGLRSRSLVGALLFGPLVGVAGYFVCRYLSMYVIQIMSHFQVTPEAQSVVEAVETTTSTLWVVSFGVISIVFAPIVEELVFRGTIFPVLKQLGYPGLAWWGTSLLFAASHANLQAFLPLTVLALMLTWIYDRTDNLMASILAHGTFNAINFALMLNYTGLLSGGAPR